MSLPKVNTPVYETVLPSTGAVIKYRPFLVKEEKILLTAMEAEDDKVVSNAVNQIIKNCVQGIIDNGRSKKITIYPVKDPPMTRQGIARDRKSVV